MSKYGKLVKKIEVFERLAVVGNKKEFLKSLAQALPNGTVSFPDETLSDLLGRLGGSISNLITHLQKPEAANALSLATQLAREVGSYRSPTYVSSKEQLDKEASDLTRFLAGANTLFGLADKANLDADAKNLVNQAKQDAASVQTLITSFYRNQGLPTVDPRETTPAASQAEPAAAKPAPKATDAAKAMAKSLVAIVNKLPEGPRRKEYLSVVDKGVRHLQNTFRNLQNSNGLQDYFAKMEITKALQQTYSQLNYDDLSVVKSLEGGNGVPDSPDAKI